MRASAGSPPGPGPDGARRPVYAYRDAEAMGWKRLDGTDANGRTIWLTPQGQMAAMPPGVPPPQFQILVGFDGPPGPMRWWWLSFADPEKPAGEQFLGAIVIQAASQVEAVKASWDKGINPGGQIMIAPMPEESPGQYPLPQFVDRLIGPAEAKTLTETRWWWRTPGPGTDLEIPTRPSDRPQRERR